MSCISLSTALIFGGPLPASIYLIKGNNKNSKTECETYSKLTNKTAEIWKWSHSSTFIVPFELISFDILVFLLLNLNKQIIPGYFKFRISLTECSDVVAYSKYKNCGREAGNVEIPTLLGKQTRLSYSPFQQSTMLSKKTRPKFG